MEIRNQPVYLNDVQRDLMTVVQAKDTVLVAGRAFGKGMVHALWNLRNFQRMPGSITGFVSANIKRALTNTLPSMLIHWENWGFKRNVHWCLGIQPPASWGWREPIFPVRNFENVLSFCNGSIGYIISQDRTGTSNSQSYDALDIDEAKFIDYERLKDETFPALRGNRQYFGKRFYHHSMLITSDMPVTKKGSWFLDWDKKSTPEVIEMIRATIFEIRVIEKRVRELAAKGVEPPKYLRGELTRLNRTLCQLRSVAVDYREVSTIDNMVVLGEAFIKQLKRDLPPLTFQTSVLCKRIGIMRDGFYSSMTERHKYSATNFSHLDNLAYDFDKIKEPTSLMDADVDPRQPICVGFDYNTNINWAVSAQPRGKILLILKSFFVKYERKLEQLVCDFCKYYRHHQNKRVIFYFDSTAKQGAYAVNDTTFETVIFNAFRANGWLVTRVDIGKPMDHMLKHLLINRMFDGRAHLVPMFNVQNNEELLTSIQTAGVYNGKKDKRGEKLAETEEDRLEARTDGSDAFDTVAIGCEKFPQHNSSIAVTSSIL